MTEQEIRFEVSEGRGDKLDWDRISTYQKLSEEFMIQFADKLDWNQISKYQKLSEEFMIQFQDKLDWNWISIYQKLSEEFMIQFADKLDSSARRNFDLLSKLTKEESTRRALEYAKEYGLATDDDYLYAFREHDMFNRGMFNKTISYDEVGVEYRDWHCDPDPNRENSYGLGVFPEGNTPIKVKLEDFVIHVPDSNKARVWSFTRM